MQRTRVLRVMRRKRRESQGPFQGGVQSIRHNVFGKASPGRLGFPTVPTGPATVNLRRIGRIRSALWLESCIGITTKQRQSRREQDQSATEDYSESGPEIQIFRLRRNA